MNNVIKRVWNKNTMVNIEDLQGMAFQAESEGHTFQISGIDGEGNTVALYGTPTGVMLRADGQDVTLTCSVSGGVVSATLPANAYSVPGRFGLKIFLTSDGQKTAIYAAVGTVGKTSSGTVAPPAGSDVVDLVNAIAAAVATIPASYTDLMAAVAPTYSSSGLYAVGNYAWYNGKLYRCTTAITSGETWTSGHWTLANLGSDLVDLKSAITQSSYNLYAGKISNATIGSNGKIVRSDNTYDLFYAPITQGKTYSVRVKDTTDGFLYAFFTNEPSYNDNNISYNNSRDSAASGTPITAPITGYLVYRDDIGFDKPQVNEGNTLFPYAGDLTAIDYESRKDLEELSKNFNDHVGSVISNTKGVFNIFDSNATWDLKNGATKNVSYPDVSVSVPVAKAYSSATCVIDVTGVNNVNIGIQDEESTLVTSNAHLRFGKYVNGEFDSWFYTIRNPVYPLRETIDTSDIDQLGIGFVATGSSGEICTETFKKVTVSTEQISLDVVNPKTVSDWEARNDLKTLENNVNKDDVPAYYYENNYLPNKLARINELAKQISCNGDVFIFITDTHWEQNAQKSKYLLKAIKEQTHINRMFVGGDMGNQKATNADLYFKMASDMRDYFGGEIHYIMGNHEYLGNIDGEITTEENLYYYFRMYAENEVGSNNRHYYYVDNAKQKIRYIILNSYAESINGGASANSGFENTQCAWFTDYALNVETGWTIIIFAHSFYSLHLNDDYTVTENLPTIAIKFRDAVLNYSGNGIIAAFICGHAHFDHITSLAGIPMIVSTSDKNRHSGEENLSDSYAARTTGTINEQAFDAVFIDKTNRTIRTVRIGYPDTVIQGEAVEERSITY